MFTIFVPKCYDRIPYQWENIWKIDRTLSTEYVCLLKLIDICKFYQKENFGILTYTLRGIKIWPFVQGIYLKFG